MYLTQMDIVKLNLANNKNHSVSDVIREVINDDIKSEEKKAMDEGLRYYDLKNEILNYDFRQYYLNNELKINTNKSNNLITHPYHGLLVDQKADYMVGKPISLTIEDEGYSKELNLIFGKKFNDLINTAVVRISNKGREYLHPYINKRQEFDFVLADAREIIPIYDTSFQKDLVGVFRYYKIKVKREISGETKELYKVEIWDSEKVTYYAENDDGNFVLDSDQEVNPKNHWYLKNEATGYREGKSWGRVPFVEMKNNDLMKSDLTQTKRLIDDYDFQVSDMSNKLADVARLVWVLQGYQGTELAEFVKNLNTYNAIKVKEKGAVETKSSDIPHEAHNRHLDRLEDNIYIFGRGVNMRKADGGLGNSPSQVALKVMYGLLDLKCNTAISKLTLSLEEFSWFATKFINMTKRKDYDYRLPEFTFNKSIILNEKEQADMARESKGIISDETLLAHHPLVNDPKKEIEAMKNDNDPISWEE